MSNIPGASSQPNGQSVQQASASDTHANGTPGAVQPPDSEGAGATSTDDGQSDQPPDTQGAINAGKLKARDALAAAQSNAESPAPSGASSATPNGSTQANGGPHLSRKRSRDGTQLPLNQSRLVGVATGPAITPEEHTEALLDRYMQRDLLHAAALNDQSERSRDLVRTKEIEKNFLLQEVQSQRRINPGSVFGYGYMGYGNGFTNRPQTEIRYNALRPPPKGRKSRSLYVPRKDTAQQAEQHEELVPIRLDIELDKLRLRDTFTWNLHERLISQDMFADYLLEDLRVPPENLHEVSRQIRTEMQEQIHNYYPHIIVEDGPLEPGRPYNDHKDDEMRIQIKLNITIGRITLLDQFEWDINNPLNSPEEFARQMACENALSGEFTTAIAHSIREQSQLYTKSLYLTNHCFDGRPVEDPELRDSFLAAPLHSAFRPQQTQKDWTPYMYEMSEAELDRTETSMMREHRAQKRQLNRRGGPALPDLKDRQRTIRSLFVHTVIPGAVETFETTGITKTRRSGRGGRRVGPRGDVDVDSEDLDSDESGAESPAPSNLNPGTARTRGMRGAATAAAAAMRGAFARSATPDSQLAGLETRTSRRSMLREESVAGADEEETLLVKLKISKAKFRTFWDDYRAKKRASEYPLSGYASQPPPPAAVGTPARGGGASALGTPAMTPRSLPHSRSTPQPNGLQKSRSTPQTAYDAQGRVDMDHWPTSSDTPPPPPPWLNDAISTLRDLHPESDFEPIMKPYCVDATTGANVRATLEPGAAPAAGTKLQYAPRIRCNDCPGKIYTAAPGKVVEDFEVHLRNRIHKQSVASRRGN